jgi:hypothetical protein
LITEALTEARCLHTVVDNTYSDMGYVRRDGIPALKLPRAEQLSKAGTVLRQVVLYQFRHK